MAVPVGLDFLEDIVAVQWHTPSPPQTGRDWLVIAIRTNDIPISGNVINTRFVISGQNFDLLIANNPAAGAKPNPHKIVKADLSTKLLPFKDYVGFRQVTPAQHDGVPTFKTVGLALAITPTLFPSTISIRGFVRCSKNLDGAAAIVVTTIRRDEFVVNATLDLDQSAEVNSPASVSRGEELMAYRTAEQGADAITVDPVSLVVTAP